VSKISQRILVSSMLVALTAVHAWGADPTADSSNAATGWDFDLAVYAWLPSIEGKLNYDLPAVGDTLTLDIDTILDNLEMTGMLAFAARKGSWTALADVVYMDLSNTKRTSVPISIDPGTSLDVGATMTMTSWIVQAGAAYELARTDRSEVGFVMAARYLSIDNGLSIEIDPFPPELPSPEFSQDSELYNVVIGVRGRCGKKWSFPYHFDLGAGDSRFTWQAMAGIGRRWDWGSVFVVYRYLSFDQGDDQFLNELNVGGPAVGARFHF